MEKKELETALAQHGQAIEAKREELKTALETMLSDKAEELKGEIADLEAKREAMQTQLDEIATKAAKLEKKGAAEPEFKSLDQAIKEVINSDEYKSAKAAKFANNNIFEVKASTADITGTVNRTMNNYNVNFEPLAPLAFYPRVRQGFIGSNLSRVMWIEGTYTSNVGYVGEGAGNGNDDSGKAVEKTRGMAKISAKLPLTAELLEDADYIASAFRMKLQENSLEFADDEFYTGNGDDANHPDHIYGIVGQSTPLDLETNGVLASVDRANVGDVLDAVLLQAKNAKRKIDTIWMNPTDVFKWRHAKTSTGEYVFTKQPNGSYSVGGATVVESVKVTANTFTAADTSKIQAWWKRNPQIKFSQMNGTDFADDKYLAVLFMRVQCVIEGPDKTAVIHVANVATAVQDLTKAVA